MIYTKLTKLAMRTAYEAHKDVIGKDGCPYIFHPFHLAEQMDKDEYAVCVALLHDVVEDCEGYSFESLSQLGFPPEVIEPLKLLTHSGSDLTDEQYFEYVKNIRSNPTALKVKKADLKHNMDLSRLDDVTDSVKKRLEKYEKSLELLKE